MSQLTRGGGIWFPGDFWGLMVGWAMLPLFHAEYLFQVELLLLVELRNHTNKS